MAKKALTYAQALNEIETILDRLRDEEMDIDRLTAELTRATELIALCRERLRKAETEADRILE